MRLLDTPGQLIDKLMVVNMKLWHTEDAVRDCDYEPERVSELKRKIDSLNSQRNKIITEIDRAIKEGDWSPFDQHKDYGRTKGQG